jgi:hypothetical protein
MRGIASYLYMSSYATDEMDLFSRGTLEKDRGFAFLSGCLQGMKYQ